MTDNIPAHCPDDQKAIDDLKEHVESFSRDNEKLKKDFHEYMVRHPENVDVKNGKTYEYKAEAGNDRAYPHDTSNENKRPGAVKGHKGYHRSMPGNIDREVTISADRCSYCWSELSDTVETRERTIEDIPCIKPVVTRYTIERSTAHTVRRS